MKKIILAGIVLAPGAVLAADLSGTWKIDSSVGETAVTISCTLVQSGNALSGSCQPQVDGIPPSDLTGIVDGSNARWGYDVVFNGNPERVDYEAEILSDDAMTGNMILSGSPTPFTAAKGN